VKALELFAGAGGAALGLRQAGAEALACVEWDDAAVATLRAAGFPAVQADLKTWSWDGERPDLLWSSFPCQVWSMAGNREGAKDTERNGWPWTLRLIDETSPTWVVLENVKGLTMHTEATCGSVEDCAGCYLDGAILAELGKRYASVQHVVLNAADYGVPQHRRRLIVVAGPRSIRWPEPTHAAPDQTLGLFGELLPWVTMGEALGLDLAVEYRNHSTEKTKPARSMNEPCKAIRAGSNADNGIRVLGGFVLEHGRNNDNNPNQERPTPSTEPACTIGGKGNQYIQQPAPTVTTTEVKGTRFRMHGGPDRASDALWLGTGRRRLTVAECATLQDFPLEHPWHGTKADQYRQVGNAVPPTLARVVIESIMRAAL